MVGRDRPLLRQLVHVFALREGQSLCVCMRRHDHGDPRRVRQLAPQLRLLQHIDPGRHDRARRDIPGALRFQVVLGAADEGYHALVGLPGAVAERKNAMAHEHHADRMGAGLARILACTQTREIESRHDVGNDHHRIAVDLAYAAFALWGIGDGQHRVGMGVIHELVGQAGVQDGLDRRRRRRGLEHVGGKLVDHLRVRQRIELRQAQQIVELHRRESGRLYGFQVPAAAFDVQDVFVLAEQVFLRQLDRGVAAAVQHQGPVAPEQARTIGAQLQFTLALRRFAVVPQTLHVQLAKKARIIPAMPRPSFSVRLCPWDEARVEARRIRELVFVREQGVPLALEMDDQDAHCDHALALAEDGLAVGTGRLLPDGHIGRMAVLKEWRAMGVGALLLQALIEQARQRGHARVRLNAQAYAAGFYRRYGFEVSGAEFMEAGIPHVAMQRGLATAPA